VVRAAVPPASLTPQVRAQLSEMDSQVPLSQVAALDSAVGKTMAEPRLRATLLGLFAGLAMVLAAIGVYGVVAFLVGQRTQEIGVRRALGAPARDVVGMLVRESMRPVMAGIVMGLAVTAHVASIVPARRALAVDPISAVRGQS